MSLHEVEEFLQMAVEVVRASPLDDAEKTALLFPLAHIPSDHDLDAADLALVELAGLSDAPAPRMTTLDLLLRVATLAETQGDDATLYATLAFVLNFGPAYFSRQTILAPTTPEIITLREIYRRRAKPLSHVDPLHETLTLFVDGNEWFEGDHAALVTWFFED